MDERKACFTFFESFYRAATECGLSDAQRLEFYDALCAYAFDGVEPEFDGALKLAFTLCRPVVKRKNGVGGRPRKAKAETVPKTVAETVSETVTKTVSENCFANSFENPSMDKDLDKDLDKEGKEPPLSPLGGPVDFDAPPDASFPLQCLAVLNEELGASYGSLPPSVAGYLSGQGDRYSVEDVRAMVRYKRDEWTGTELQRNLVPKTLFGAEHFEGYIAQSKMAPPEESGEVIDDGLAEYLGLGL